MIPVFAFGFFKVSPEGTFTQHIIYEYSDPEGEISKILSDSGLLERELRELKESMQGFLDKERVLVNGEEAHPKVVAVSIGVMESRRRAFIEYLIEFKGRFKSGVNTYENHYEPEVAEYSYEVMWVFPEGSKVMEVNVGFDYVLIGGRVLTFYVPEGSETPGYEKISFYLP